MYKFGVKLFWVLFKNKVVLDTEVGDVVVKVNCFGDYVDTYKLLVAKN